MSEGPSPILMPKLGLTMTEGLIASWRVGPGDHVRAGDVLFVVETEKIANEIEATAEGHIATIEVAEGDTVPVGAVVATWSGPAPDARASDVSPSAAPMARGANGRGAGSGRIVATPLARRLARERRIDLASVAGSGPRGRIKAADVEQVRPQPREPDRAEHHAPAPSSARAATPVEKAIARRVTLSKQTIPHFYVMAEADVTQLLRLREELNSEAGKPRISINHAVLAALGRVLVRRPQTNAIWADDAIVTLADSDVGIAVDSERGLIVPVLRQAGAMTLDALAAAATDLVQRARDGRLTPADLEGGAVSVSNVGMHGASYLVPIVNPGQSAILGVGAVRPMFRPDERGAPALRQELGLVLSCDHRVFDGVGAARLLGEVVHLLERPSLLLRM